MDSSIAKKAIKLYQKIAGNFRTMPALVLKKESDLAMFYYPGIEGVLAKVKEKPDTQGKYCVHHRTFGLISTKNSSHYPLLTAKAALLSQVANVNVIPLLVRYGEVHNLPKVLNQLSPNFRAILCTDFSAAEKAVVREKMTEIAVPVFFHDQMEAAAVLSALHSSAKMMKKTIKKAKIVLEGEDELIGELLRLLAHEGLDEVTLVDHKGALYEKRPNMNQAKNELVKIMKAKKDTRSREEILGSADMYVNSSTEPVPSSTTQLLGDKAVIISLKAASVALKGRQSLISTLPNHPNHLTDLHLPAGLFAAMAEGKKYGEETILQAVKALSGVFKSPQQKKLFPGLLEKNLAKKVANGIK